mmetsp:Transcript_12008/g.43843  ORF Transcript_12008/g.43843 Transcript_12008/m.43843 type:complete len:94 (+) Transcript_12008:52-333(+)|eukprot:scaffold1439_cov404-Prasinococcus_capsulatus_cf.AAC.37
MDGAQYGLRLFACARMREKRRSLEEHAPEQHSHSAATMNTVQDGDHDGARAWMKKGVCVGQRATGGAAASALGSRADPLDLDPEGLFGVVCQG